MSGEEARGGFSKRAVSWGLLLVVAAGASLLTACFLWPVYMDTPLLPRATTEPASTMPHYPPLYGYFVWALHALANGLAGTGPGPSDAGIFTLALAQQVLLTLAFVYVALSYANSLIARVVALLPLYALPF